MLRENADVSKSSSVFFATRVKVMDYIPKQLGSPVISVNICMETDIISCP